MVLKEISSFKKKKKKKKGGVWLRTNRARPEASLGGRGQSSNQAETSLFGPDQKGPQLLGGFRRHP